MRMHVHCGQHCIGITTLISCFTDILPRNKWSSSKFTVAPGSRVYYAWSFFISLLALLTTWITCYVAGFGRFTVSTAFNGGVGGTLMLSILYIIDAFCVLDIVVSSRTATFTPYGKNMTLSSTNYF